MNTIHLEPTMKKLSRLILCLFVISTFSFVPVHAEESNTVSLTVLHWNDFHANNVEKIRVTDEGDTLVRGGSAYLGAYLDHYREFYPRTIEFNAGDDFQGSPISMVTKGQSQVDIMNLLKPDVFTVGNHEFDYGWENVVETFSKAEFPVLLGNVVKEDSGERLFDRETIVDVDGVKVGVIGVVTEGLKIVTTAKVTKGLKVLPKVETVRKSLEYLNPITDIQIILSHSGYWEDSVMAAEIGDEVELIVGGHSHTRIEEPIYVNGVPIVQANAVGRYLGIVEMQIDTLNNKVVELDGRIERIDNRFPKNQAINDLVTYQESTVAKEMDVVIADLITPLKRSYGSESNIGNWVTDSFRKYTDADITFVNNGGLRKDLEAGPITIRNILEVCPFSNELIRFKVSGKQLKEFVLFQVKENNYLQMSGMRYHTIGGEIISLTVGGEQVEEDREYSIVTLNYVTDHMKRFFNFDPENIVLENLYLIDREVLVDIAKQEKIIEVNIENRALVE